MDSEHNSQMVLCWLLLRFLFVFFYLSYANTDFLSSVYGSMNFKIFIDSYDHHHNKDTEWIRVREPGQHVGDSLPG